MKKFTKIELNYSLDALEPFISKETMDLHYNKHHTGYESGLNKSLEGVELPEDIVTLKNLMMNFHQIKDDIVKVQVRRFGGGLINHNHFFSTLKKNVVLTEDMAIYKALIKHFGSFQEFKDIFVRHATRLFGSGWAWLTLNNQGQFKILTTQNQDNPWMIRKVVAPLVSIDVWEHAYYVDYRNRRAEYIEAFFNIIDWEKVNELYLDGLKALESGEYKIIQPNKRTNFSRNYKKKKNEPPFAKIKIVDTPKTNQEESKVLEKVKHKEDSLKKEEVVDVVPDWNKQTFNKKDED